MGYRNTGIQDTGLRITTGYRMQDTGHRTQDTVHRIQNLELQNTEYRTQKTEGGHRIQITDYGIQRYEDTG